VLLATTTFVAATPPMLTVAPETRFVPVRVTVVPPSVVPDAGVTAEIVGAVEKYVKPDASVPLWASGLVTVTLTEPATWLGVVAVIDVALATTTLVAAVPPTVTVAPGTKFVPVIVMAVPPSVDPDAGATVDSVGAVAER